jgi:very-short-patch-repair endonuclease
MTDSRKYSNVLMSGAALAFDDAKHVVLRRCESEIEKLLMIAFWTRSWTGDLILADSPMLTGHPLVKTHEDLRRLSLEIGQYTPVVAKQVHVGSYRVDFCIASPSLEHFDTLAHLLAVECDGHDFHERTKQQASRDKSRDRELMEHGVSVVRFTGSEIWRDALGCAEQALRLANKPVQEGLERKNRSMPWMPERMT